MRRLVFPGVDAGGGPLEPPTTAANFAARLLRGARNPNEAREVTAWRERLGLGPDRRPAADVDPLDLRSAGWGMIVPERTKLDRNELLRSMAPLRNHRESEAGAAPVFPYRFGDTKASFMSRRRVIQGPAHPDRLPYYLLLVGDLDEIPARFQYLLDLQYAVGRVAFDTLDEYERYATSVVEVETEGQHSVRPEAVFCSVRNRGDEATRRSHDHLMEPLRELLEKERRTWPILPSTGRKHELSDLLGGEKTPALLFTAAHGLSYHAGHSRQRDLQGAILSREWTPGTRVEKGHRFAADDVGPEARVQGLVAFFFGCFSAGTPEDDGFPPPPMANRRRLAPEPFVSRLAQRLLAHPRGGALAVLGHLDRAWTCSFGTGEVRGARHVESTIKYLLDGYPVGHAMDWMNERYGELASELTDVLDAQRSSIPGAPSDPAWTWVADTWRAHADARNFVVLGDPAVRLASRPRDEPSSAAATPASDASSAAVRAYLRSVARREPVSTEAAPAELLWMGRTR